MTAGSVDVVRSSQAEREELLFIIGSSGSVRRVQFLPQIRGPALQILHLCLPAH